MNTKRKVLSLLSNNYGEDYAFDDSNSRKRSDSQKLGYRDLQAKKETKKRKRQRELKKTQDRSKAESENKKLKEYYSENKSALNLLLCGILGILFYLILPPGYKIFSFLVPAISISIVFSDKRFSFIIFTTQLMLFILFPTSIFTLDSSKSFNLKLIKTQNYIENTTSVVSGIVFIAIPIIAFLGSLWAFYKGNVEEGTAMLQKLVFGVIMVSIAVFVFEQFNVPIISDLKPFTVFSDFILGSLTWIGNTFGNIVNGIDIFDTLPDIPNIPSNLSLDASMNDLQDFNLMLIGSFPILLNLFAVVFGLIFAFTSYKIPSIKLSEKTLFSRPRSFNPVFLAYLGVIWIGYFYYYLFVGEENFLNYRTTGFYTIYLSIISGACIISAFGGISYSKINERTILGILLGVFGLFAFQNLFTQSQTLDAYLLEANGMDWNNLIGQIIAVAPAESFLFHIFTSGLYLTIVFLQYKNYNDSKIEKEINRKQEIIQRKQRENELYQTKLIKPKQALSEKHKKELNKNDVGDLDDYISRINDIQRLENDISKLKTKKEKDIEFDISKITKNEKYGLYFIILLSNFLFATMHCVLLTPYGFGYNFKLFWSSALGLIYLFSGIILSYVSFKYGWITSIICHLINNTAIYAMILLGGLI